MAILATMGSDITSCTPSTLRIFQENVSIAVISAWLVHSRLLGLDDDIEDVDADGELAW